MNKALISFIYRWGGIDIDEFTYESFTRRVFHNTVYLFDFITNSAKVPSRKPGLKFTNAQVQLEYYTVKLSGVSKLSK